MDAYPNPAVSINWWAGLVPVAAVIPAPAVYTNTAAGKKLVVECRVAGAGWLGLFFVTSVALGGSVMAESSLLPRLHSIPAARLDRGTMSFRKSPSLVTTRHFAQNACANEAVGFSCLF